MQCFKEVRTIVGANARAYITINVVFYGLILGGMLLAVAQPAIQTGVIASSHTSLARGPMLIVRNTYGNFVAAVAVTFLINSLVGTFAEMTLPSLTVPFSAFAVGVYRPVFWGILFAPTTRELKIGIITHSLTLAIEGQAYVLALFAAYLTGKWWVAPQAAGFQTHMQGYRAGLQATRAIYPLVLLILIVAAIYESAELVLLKRILTRS